jgi:hypothetical protein
MIGMMIPNPVISINAVAKIKPMAGRLDTVQKFWRESTKKPWSYGAEGFKKHKSLIFVLYSEFEN